MSNCFLRACFFFFLLLQPRGVFWCVRNLRVGVIQRLKERAEHSSLVSTSVSALRDLWPPPYSTRPGPGFVCASEWPFMRAAVDRADLFFFFFCILWIVSFPLAFLCAFKCGVCARWWWWWWQGRGLTSGTGTCVFASKGRGQGGRDGIEKDNPKWFHPVCCSKRAEKIKVVILHPMRSVNGVLKRFTVAPP